MKYLLCLILSFVCVSSYCQGGYDEDEDLSRWSNFPDPFIMYKRQYPHDSCMRKSFRERIFNERISNIYLYAEYYVAQSREKDFEHIILRIKDERWKNYYWDRMVMVCELERYLKKQKANVK